MVFIIFSGEEKIKFYLLNCLEHYKDSKNKQHLRASPFNSSSFYLREMYPETIKNKDL